MPKRDKLVTDDLWEVRETQKTCEMREIRDKKGYARDNVKIDYKRFTSR